MKTEMLINHSYAQCGAPGFGDVHHRQTIADRLEALTVELRAEDETSSRSGSGKKTLAAVAGQLYEARRSVDRVFAMQGFAVSPAWDILLDLYRARSARQEISVSSASIGAACAATTALRWLAILEEMQLTERRPDADDKRRVFVDLTNDGVMKIEKALISYYR